MTRQAEFIQSICAALDGAGIRYMIGGSIASSIHGPHRSTNDVDIVIAPTAEQLDRFLVAVSEYYVSRQAAHEAFRRRSMFNVIDADSGNKADLILLKQRPYSETELSRRVCLKFAGQDIYVASAEDVILTKLEWSRIGESERQFRDAFNVAAVVWAELDMAYLKTWAVELNVEDLLERLLDQADPGLSGGG